MQIILRGDKSVTNFIENLKKGKTTMYHASGMIVGCAGSGKTTLLERLKGIDLEEIKKNISSTRGVDIHTDVFDVTDSIQANSSNQQQRFKLKLDKKDLHQSVPESHSENTADDRKTQEKMETDDDEGHAIHASNSGQISRDDTNIKTTSFSPPQGAISTSNLAEATKENKDILGPNNPEISGNLQIDAKNIPEYPDKKITMTDFAGQCSYYASHQIFLNPRAFFILVLNMEKKFDDQVGEEVCCQEGSIYERWTHRDYLEFWMKSIHQYSNDKAPVLLIGTHSEKKTEKEIMTFFHEIWATLEMKDKALYKHLHEDRQFAVGFHDNESIENIKLSIVKVVQNLNHWGEKLPLSWVMFEKFFQENKSQRIMKKEMLLAFNDALPTGIKLKTVDDINFMLQFFHDIREILYFNQELLDVVIILDVQWFANLFKNVITDRNHAEKDLCRFASDWKKFDQTGELNDTLLTAIWEMTGIAFSEHKTNVMLYMEKLGLLAKLDDKKWYVPCMNKMPCPDNLSSSCPASSIFCYVFDVLPVGIFHRLVATCLQIPWEIVTERGRLCIYQTAAVFLFKGQNVLLGMTPREIQLQVFVIKGGVEISKCQEIKAEIDRMLNVLSRTFQTDFRFMFGFKCKATGFCDSQESSVINESEFTKAFFQCPSCPIGRKHIINSKNITKYWVQVHDDEVEPSEDKGISISSPSGSSGPNNFAKILKLLQVGTEAVRICFDKFFPKEDLEKTLKANETDMRRGQFRFLQPQLEILFPKQGTYWFSFFNDKSYAS
ncbi:probable serine/threonine-protein kinase pats1 isoform X2 [Saccostrea cucullata]|uniref:probable serine/threonine-protein kinase pats1 isoform X2 n=1 Tax=Saccostrea cuccullata TaxID=36930 RepID=UPI002ED651BF